MDEKLKQKIKKEKELVKSRYVDYTEKELLALILFELRGIGYKLSNR